MGNVFWLSRVRCPLSKWLLGACLVVFSKIGFADPSLYVVTADTNASTLSSVAISDILSGKQRKWPNGAPLVVVLPGKEATYFQAVGKQWFGGSGAAMQRHWLRLVFSGRANVPLYAQSSQDTLTLLSQTAGSVGVIDQPPSEGYHILAVVER